MNVQTFYTPLGSMSTPIRVSVLPSASSCRLGNPATIHKVLPPLPVYVIYDPVQPERKTIVPG